MSWDEELLQVYTFYFSCEYVSFVRGYYSFWTFNLVFNVKMNTWKRFFSMFYVQETVERAVLLTRRSSSSAYKSMSAWGLSPASVIMAPRCWMAPWVYIGLLSLFTDSSLTLTATKFIKRLQAGLADCCPHNSARSNILHLNGLPLLSLTQKPIVSVLIGHFDDDSWV